MKGDNPYLHGVVDRRYRVDATIGRGFTGEVFVAHDLVADRRCALRIVHSEVLSERGFVETFQRDLAVIHELRDPHAVELYAVGRLLDGAPYVVTELMEGISLSVAIANIAPMAWPAAFAICAQICAPLHRAHQLGFAHRRLTPAKIFLEPQTRAPSGGDPYRDAPAVTDFARLDLTPGLVYRAPSPDSQLVKPRLGHVDYLSPELLGGDRFDHRTDIFSLGCILYEMVTGVIPFASASGIANRTLAWLTMPLPPPTLRRGVAMPPAAEAIIMKCLARRPWERFTDLLALRDALRSLL
jgi:serine/threonine-protein kinase